MTKQCPHCHESSFGWRELMMLDYFSPQACKICGNIVRNDGFRQLLTVPTILINLLLGGVVFSLLPIALESFGFLLIFVLVVSSIIVLAKPVKVEPPKMNVRPFTPNLHNDKVVSVAGWTEEELQKIVDDFTNQASEKAPKIDIVRHDERLFRLAFPEDLSPFDFAALVNYLNYPFDFDSSARSIVVAGETTLNSDFQGVPSQLMGTKAILSVPENDHDYTVVCMQTENGDVLALSLSDPEAIWKPINTSLLAAARDLSRRVSTLHPGS